MDCIFLPCDAMQVRPMWSCGVCVSVVHFVKTDKHILKFFFTVWYLSHSSFSAKWHCSIRTGVELLIGGRRQVG